MLLAMTCLPVCASELTDDYIDIASGYCVSGNYREAMNYLNKALAAEPGNMKVKELKSGLERIMAKQPAGTQVSSKPNSSDVSLALMAKANLEAGKYTDAEFDINRALQMNDDITYKFIKGKILYQEGRYKEAKAILEPMTNEFKTSELFKYIGLCDYGMGNYTDALMNLDKAIILSDEDKTLEAKYNEIKMRMQN